ncbi:MAG: hypothetical protein PHV05_02780 [Candidatus Riflebacteria bacterium]|nr:hypothetical protein [Candidatus Riflebacteria bacterium]
MKMTGTFLPVMFLLAFFLYTGNSSTAVEEQNIQKTRRLLLQIFNNLDLTALEAKDRAYLNSLGAGFDESNNEFFVEIAAEQNKGAGQNILVVVRWADCDKVLLSIFPAPGMPHQWLKCRLQKLNDQIYAHMLYLPAE